MTTSIKTLALLAAVVLMYSFTNVKTDQFYGTYGVSASDPSHIKLIINADHTFYYQDFSVSDKKIVSEGTWKRAGNKVVLEDNDTDLKFHTIWTFHNNGQTAKSRKGLAFYRLCRLDE